MRRLLMLVVLGLFVAAPSTLGATWLTEAWIEGPAG